MIGAKRTLISERLTRRGRACEITARPDVKLLATIREPLHVKAGHVYPGPRFQLPDLRHPPDLYAFSQQESVALFMQRAQAVQPSFEVTTANASVALQVSSCGAWAESHTGQRLYV